MQSINYSYTDSLISGRYKYYISIEKHNVMKTMKQTQQKIDSCTSYKLIRAIMIPLFITTLCLPVITIASSDNNDYELFNGRYHAVFTVQQGKLEAKYTPNQHTQQLGIYGWERIKALFPAEYRKGIVQFNVMAGRRWAGQFGGDGKNDVGRTGYSLSVAKYVLEQETQLSIPNRTVTPRRATLDWTLVHEIGHYICLITNAIELFSQSFDGDMVEQPTRRKRPLDYPKDGSPKTEGNFVTSYAERTPGDEEVVETFTTYMTIKELPTNNSLVARKIRFFNSIEGFPELRAHIQSINDQP